MGEEAEVVTEMNNREYIEELTGALPDWIVEQIADELDKRDAEIKKLKQEQEKLVALATPILAQFKRSRNFLDLATSDVRDLLKAICDKD